MDSWQPKPPPLPVDSDDSEVEPTGVEERGEVKPPASLPPKTAKERLVEAAKQTPRSVAEMIRDGLKVSDLSEDEIERLLEHTDQTMQAKRVQIYTYLRTQEGFSREELDELDKYPLSQLGKESRRILALRAKQGQPTPSEDYGDDDGPPTIIARKASYRPFVTTPKYDPMTIIKSSTASKREKDKARIEILKQRAQKPRVPRTSV